MKTKAPKDQIERYTNPGMTHFKGDKPNALIPYHWKINPVTDVHEPFYDLSRGKATEKK